MARQAEAEWKGDLKGGSGRVKLGSGAYEGNYSFATRFENGAGANPEELIGAALAGCYSMALANSLAQAGFTATERAQQRRCPPGQGRHGLPDQPDRTHRDGHRAERRRTPPSSSTSTRPMPAASSSGHWPPSPALTQDPGDLRAVRLTTSGFPSAPRAGRSRRPSPSNWPTKRRSSRCSSRPPTMRFSTPR